MVNAHRWIPSCWCNKFIFNEIIITSYWHADVFGNRFQSYKEVVLSDTYCLSFPKKNVFIWSRNRMAENLYGYSASEALGAYAIELLADPRDYAVASDIVHRVEMGESWTGQFPVKNKGGERFLVVATNTPFYDDDGALVGLICVSTDSRPFQEAQSVVSVSRDLENESSLSRPRSIASAKLGLDLQQPLQAAIASKISDLVSILL